MRGMVPLPETILGGWANCPLTHILQMELSNENASLPEPLLISN